MPWWKYLLLSGYYHASFPLRRGLDAAAAWRGRAPLTVLLYHRVADDAANPWTISNAEFARHIEWLRARFELVSLSEVQRRMAQPKNARPAVALTFDDGYAENCTQALPLLIRWRIPCTYFVCTSAVLEGRPFGHDLRRGQRFEPNTLEQIQALAAAGIEIGAHSRTHADLGSLGVQALRDEIVASTAELAQALGRPIRYFAYPFGGPANFTARGFELAAEAGLEGVCSAYGGYNFPGEDPFHIQRISVDGPLLRVRNWLTLDPYRLLTVRRLAGPQRLIAEPSPVASTERALSEAGRP